MAMELRSLDNYKGETMDTEGQEAESRFDTERMEKIAEKLTEYGKGSAGDMWLYCGTYHKYNNGSLFGRWLCLNDFSDKDDFLEFCAYLHRDEEDPEFMFQDQEGIPSDLYSESGVNEKLWDLIALDADELEIVKAYWESIDSSAEPSDIMDRYQGTHTTLADYVEQWWDDCGEYKRDDKNWWSPINYVDWERMAHDLETSGDVHTIEGCNGVMVFNAQ